ncbi:MAG: hypothetical protein WCE20_18830 [Rhizomicrobium sp.]
MSGIGILALIHADLDDASTTLAQGNDIPKRLREGEQLIVIEEDFPEADDAPLFENAANLRSRSEGSLHQP